MSVNTRTTLNQIIGNQDASKKKISPRQRFFVFLVFFFSGVLMCGILLFQLPSGMESGEYQVGEPSPRTLFSPFEVKYPNEKLTQSMREKKAAEVLPVFIHDTSAVKTAREKLENFFKALQEHRANPAPDKVLPADKLPLKISDASLKHLVQTDKFDDIRNFSKDEVEKSLNAGVVETAQKEQFRHTGASEILQYDPATKSENKIPLQPVLTMDDVRSQVPEPFKKDRDSRVSFQEIVAAVMAPNMRFDEAETIARRSKAAAAVPAAEEVIKKDELVVQRGMLVTPESKERLVQIQKKMATRKILSQIFVMTYLIILLYSLCFAYLFFFEKKALRSVKEMVFLHTALLLNILLCKITTMIPNATPYLMPGAMASLLVAILGSQRIAFFCAVISASFVAPIVDFSPEIILMVLMSSLAGIFGTIRFRKRIQFLKVGALIGLAAFVVIFVYRIFREYPLGESLQISSFGLANGLLVTMPLCFLLVPIFEWLFNLTSEISLLELSDLNHPLLKRMIVEAPGTYHHSLVVSTLAESACEAIGANALLARVGCYFHDIGKIPRAEFFTENKSTKGGNSKHDKLTPNMSYLVILNHVKDGIDLGRQYKLKEPILRFIPEHQGRGVIYYFYRKALDKAKPGEKVNPDDYRYPGPKPQSKETAVAMLADSTEAASRSLKEPSPESIRHLVRKVINDKFIDGQLDECDLTLKDLHKIQESFIHNLMAIFHTRVSYPPPLPEACDMPDLFAEDQFDKFRTESPQHPPKKEENP